MNARKAVLATVGIFAVLLGASAALSGTFAKESSWSLARDSAVVSVPSQPLGDNATVSVPDESLGDDTTGSASASTRARAATAQGAVGSDEPIEWRLLRTLQIGSPQGVTSAQMLAYAHGNEADYTGHVLSRAALTVLGEDRDFPDWPLDKLLERTLTQLQQGRSSAYNLPAEMPDGFRGEHLVLAMVYALAVSGQEDEAIDVLEAQLASGSRFKRGVILQALRNIGTDRATGIVQQAADDDGGSLATNLLADHYYPFLHELYDHWELVPRDQRDRRSLTALAARDCGRPASVAAYLLGFFAPAADAAQQQAELDALRRVTRFERSCFYNRFFAIRSLALRSPETIDFWVDLYRNEEDAWQRAQLVRIGFARFSRGFFDTSLELLADEPVQYVQWELMHGNLELREGAKWRDQWDLWLPPTLQFRLDFPEDSGAMPDADLDALLGWLETGAYPQHPWVRNHMLYGMARHIDAATTRRFLGVFDALPDKTSQWWILSPLTDPAALPLLRYWATLDTDEQQRDDLERNIRGMETRADRTRSSSGDSGDGAACCEPTRECLLARADAAAPPPVRQLVIENEAQAQAWLRGALRQADPAAGPEVTFVDSLQRIAIIDWPGQDRRDRWEFLFGCWRRVDGAS